MKTRIFAPVVFMKRFLVIPIMALYLLAVSGVMITLHYCGKTLESWSVYAKNAGCDEGGCDDETEIPDSCCKDEVIASKVPNDQYLTQAFKFKSAPFAFDGIIPQYSFVVSEAIPGAVTSHTTYQSNAPPGLWENIPLYKLHSCLTYYG